MKKNKKGFTLAELLIVVAIIAVLVAIAIPVLNNSLEKSRQAADAANIRAAYAQAVTNMMVENKTKGYAVTQATMKTGAFDRLASDGDTLAGVTWASIDKAHTAGSYVKVAVTIDEVTFQACTDAKGEHPVSGAIASASVVVGSATD